MITSQRSTTLDNISISEPGIALDLDRSLSFVVAVKPPHYRPLRRPDRGLTYPIDPVNDADEQPERSPQSRAAESAEEARDGGDATSDRIPEPPLPAAARRGSDSPITRSDGAPGWPIS